jgi:iron-sulfur cluster assembly protein
MIKITDHAAEQIRAVSNNPDVYGMALRVAAYQEDDGNVNYAMGFDHEREADEQLICNGIEVLIAASSTPYLQGVTLDFVEMSPGDMRFIFIPPYSADAESGPETDPAAE